MILLDLRYALRSFLRSPGFAFAAVLTLALGIGANTAIFSVADAVLLRPLPYPDSSRLVLVSDHLARLGVERLGLSPEIYRQYAARDVFEKTAKFLPLERNFAGTETAERMAATIAEPGLLELLGARPLLGRIFNAADPENVAVISYALFVREFGANPSIAGKAIRLDGEAYTVIGVLPPQFRFGNGSLPTDAWTPFPPRANIGNLSMLALMKRGVSLEVAQASLDAAAKHLNETIHPHWGPNGEDPGFGASVVTLRQELLGGFRATTLLLLGAVAAVLLIACANVANLLLVRAVTREKETAVRRALGATEGRLMRQWLTESTVLALMGGAIGSVAAVWGVRALTLLHPDALPPATPIGVDGRALLFTLAISLVASLMFGLAPSLGVAHDAWRPAPGPARRHTASWLIAAEVALSLVLLVGSGLLLKSYMRLRSVDPGFNPSHILTLRVSYPPTRPLINAGLVKFFSELDQQVASIPGVVAAGAVSTLPVAGSVVNSRGGNPFSIEGQQWHPDGPVPQIAHSHTIDPEYFRAMQIPLRAGRFFTPADNAGAPAVAIVNETLARGFFPRGAIGHQIVLGAPRPGAPWLTIVGIVGDVKTAALSHETMPQFYVPMAQSPPGSMSFVIRTALDPLFVARSVAQAVRRLDPALPVYDVISMDDRIAKSIGQPRFETALLSFFAASALFLAAIGIFGVVAHSTAQRTREIGIRMALGADPSQVVRTIVWEGLRPVLIGIAIGLAGAIGIGRALSSALFHVAPTDPVAFALAAAVLAVVAFVACLGPARRASRIDPAQALRE